LGKVIRELNFFKKIRSKNQRHTYNVKIIYSICSV
jgi:hypothetical protein